VQQIFALYAAVLRGVLRASWFLGGALSRRLHDALLRRRSALPGPGAFDYRGLAQGGPTPALRQGPFPIGTWLTGNGGGGTPVGIPDQQLRLNACVVGPPGAGKTRYVVVPWIVAAARAGYSVLCVDVKGDMLDQVREHVRDRGIRLNVRARTLDYGRPNRSIRWNWLEAIDSDQAVDNAVQSILGREPPPKSDPFFFHMDGKILRGLLELAQASPRRAQWSAAHLQRLLNDQVLLERALNTYPNSPAVARLNDLVLLAPDDFAKRTAGVSVRLDALARPSLQAVTTQGTFTTGELLRDQQILSVVAPLQDGQMARSLSSLLVNDLLFRVYNRFTAQLGPPLLMMLDEAAQLADRIDYRNMLNIGRSAGMSAVLAIQDVGQFADEAERSVVLSSCSTFVSFGGVSPATAKFLSARLGSHIVPQTTVGRTPSTWGYQTTTSTAMATVPVLGEREIMHIPVGRRPAVVHARDTLAPPFLVDLG
jgi:type IV secretory pathway TraG/TraD family ATPase VirD4